MAKRNRTLSEFDIYHVTTRGVGHQIIFEDDDDRKRFGHYLRLGTNNERGELYAWCFMENHVHLLFHLDLERITSCMRFLLGAYAAYFNNKYDRIGHLFEGRFDSVPINSTEQLLAVVRYIHQNPLDGHAASPEVYRWSSCIEYATKPFITNTAPVLELFESIEDFLEFNRQSGSSYDEINVMANNCARHSAIEAARSVTGLDSPLAIASFDKQKRNEYLALLKNNGLSIREISRLTGIGRNIIQRAK